MKNPILMNFTEPTDAELKMLMGEVAKEAKRKALLAKNALYEKIMLEISLVKQRYDLK